jgi:methyltransferase
MIPAYPWGAFAGFLAVFALQRIGELVLSRRNLERLRARGAREHGARQFPWFVALHTAFPLLIALEIRAGGATPGAAWPLWVVVWLVAQSLRIASMHALGERWNVRIVVVPGEPPVTRGIYRWLRHPNYLAVALEFIAAPLCFGAWVTALVGTAANASLMSVRIPEEERALREAAGP